MQVADKPDIYMGYAGINYNNVAWHFIASQAWGLVARLHGERTAAAVKEMKEAVAGGKVFTDLQEIYRATKEGMGDLLLIHYDYVQPVRLKAKDHLEPVSDATLPGVTDDITSVIAWEVYSKKGRVFFTGAGDPKGLGKISLKVRY